MQRDKISRITNGHLLASRVQDAASHWCSISHWYSLWLSTSKHSQTGFLVLLHHQLTLIKSSWLRLKKASPRNYVGFGPHCDAYILNSQHQHSIINQ